MTGLSFRTRIVFNELPRIKAGMMPTARQVVAKAALDIEAGAKVKAPYEFGTLRNSIQARQVGGNSASGSVRWRVTVGAYYGIYQEFGTRFARAQPFLFPTVAEVRPQFVAAMRRITTP